MPEFEFVQPKFHAGQIAGVMQGNQLMVAGKMAEARGIAAKGAAIGQGMAALGQGLGEKFKKDAEEQAAKDLDKDFNAIIDSLDDDSNFETRSYTKFQFADEQFKGEVNASIPPGPHNHRVLDAMRVQGMRDALMRRGKTREESAREASLLVEPLEKRVINPAASGKMLVAIGELARTHDISNAQIQLLLETGGGGAPSHEDFEEGMRREVQDLLGFDEIEKEQRAEHRKIDAEFRKELKEGEEKANIARAHTEFFTTPSTGPGGGMIRVPVGAVNAGIHELGISGRLAAIRQRALETELDPEIIDRLIEEESYTSKVNFVGAQALLQFSLKSGVTGEALKDYKENFNIFTDRDDPLFRAKGDARVKSVQEAINASQRKTPEEDLLSTTGITLTIRNFDSKLEHISAGNPIDIEMRAAGVAQLMGANALRGVKGATRITDDKLKQFTVTFGPDGKLSATRKAGDPKTMAAITRALNKTTQPAKQLAVQLIMGTESVMNSGQLSALVTRLDARNPAWFPMAKAAIMQAVGPGPPLPPGGGGADPPRAVRTNPNRR